MGPSAASVDSDAWNAAKVGVACVQLGSKPPGRGVYEGVGEVEMVGQRVIRGLQRELVIHRNQPSGTKVDDRFEGGGFALEGAQFPIHLIDRDHRGDNLVR